MNTSGKTLCGLDVKEHRLNKNGSQLPDRRPHLKNYWIEITFSELCCRFCEPYGWKTAG